MPWSVQLQGDIVIHGFESVPPRAASRGCVRLPLTGTNPARWFYHWVDIGTPVVVKDGWPEA
jgi:lipoprotein-anchoring transpeptidase ErfK/SrfK